METITPDLDKYIRYIKCYVGKNAASIGYYSLGGQWVDSYGNDELLMLWDILNRALAGIYKITNKAFLVDRPGM